jgi:hypothetical protein
MVAVHIAGFVILFAVATVVYKAAARLVMKSRNQCSPRKLTHSSIFNSDILLGSSSRLSRSDLLLENLALRQELEALKARYSKLRKGTPENGEDGFGLGPVPLAQLKVSLDHRHGGDGRALAGFGNSQRNPNRDIQTATAARAEAARAPVEARELPTEP